MSMESIEARFKKMKKNIKFCKECGEYITDDGSCSNPICPDELLPLSKKGELKEWCEEFCEDVYLCNPCVFEDYLKKLVNKFFREIGGENMNIIKYKHHGKEVSVREDVKDKHREHCLCWKCDVFHPEKRGDNCEIANKLFKMCVEYNIVTPVWECPYFGEKKE